MRLSLAPPIDLVLIIIWSLKPKDECFTDKGYTCCSATVAESKPHFPSDLFEQTISTGVTMREVAKIFFTYMRSHFLSSSDNLINAIRCIVSLLKENKPYNSITRRLCQSWKHKLVKWIIYHFCSIFSSKHHTPSKSWWFVVFRPATRWTAWFVRSMKNGKFNEVDINRVPVVSVTSKLTNPCIFVLILLSIKPKLMGNDRFRLYLTCTLV